MRAVKTLRAVCDVVFTDPSGQSTRLDAAIVASFPSRFRAQAWKFDRTIFDVTCIDDVVYSLPEDDDRPTTGSARLTRQTPARIARSLAPFTPEFWMAAEPMDQQSTPSRLLVRASFGKDAAGQPTDWVACVIDRRTLTPVSFEPLQPTPERAGERFELAQYRLIKGIAWPTFWRFLSPSGNVEIRLRDVELNGTLDEPAFTPPKRAVKSP